MTKDEALDLALEALNTAHLAVEDDMLADEIQQAIAAIKQALAAPVQEPAAYEYGDDVFWHDSPDINDYIRANGKALVYTTPPAAQRQWTGLTDEAIWSEYQTLWPLHPAEEPRLAKDIAKFARAIEAKLKEQK